MPQETGKKWQTPLGLNLVLLGALALFCALALCVSAVTLFILPLFEGGDGTAAELRNAIPDSSFYISSVPERTISASDSPHNVSFSLRTPPLREEDSIVLAAVSGGRVTDSAECLDNSEGNYTGFTNVECGFPIQYGYAPQNDYQAYAILKRNGRWESVSAPVSLLIGWTGYESAFWGMFAILAVIAAGGLGLCSLVMAGMAFFAKRIRHQVEYADEYSISTLLNPAAVLRLVAKDPRSFVMTPIFWGFQGLGILLLLAYLFLQAQAWMSAGAFASFLMSGAFAFVVPFLLAALVWFLEYKEREPIRVIVSLFLWGGFSCMLAIGLNSTADSLLSAISLGALTAFLVAPLVEETMKGTGLVLMSFHHEYDDVADGIVYGFVIGMGFAFVENWLYFMKTPLGGDPLAWAGLWFLRSIVFAANHGVFTAFTGAVIGFLKSRNFKYAPFGFFAGVVPAMLLHAMHNSGEVWQAVCPFGGALYLLVLVPLFDYGGLVLVMAALIGWVVFVQKRDAN